MIKICIGSSSVLSQQLISMLFYLKVSNFPRSLRTWIDKQIDKRERERCNKVVISLLCTNPSLRKDLHRDCRRHSVLGCSSDVDFD